MAITDIFSKRQKRRECNKPDVFVYDKLEQSLRVKIIFLIDEIRKDSPILGNDVFEDIHDALCREYGMTALAELSKFKLWKGLGDNYDTDYFAALQHFFYTVTDVDKALDFIECIFKLLEEWVEESRQSPGVCQRVQGYIHELNYRFFEHGFGFQFGGNEILRVDSTFIHKEVVVPVIGILYGDIFRGANEEFSAAHEHYRNRRNKDCLVNCLKAFESVMKAIGVSRKWTFDLNSPAKKLISVCHSNGLFPPSLEEHMNALLKNLESGVPTLRNRFGGHGQGEEIQEVPQHYASFCLHLTASNILFLAKCHEELK